MEDTLICRQSQIIHEDNEFRGNDDELAAGELRVKYSVDWGAFTDAKMRLERRTVSIREGLDLDDQRKYTEELMTTTNNIPVDPSLFAGLEDTMTTHEQQYVTELLTSGSVDKVARAAHILSEISKVVRCGINTSLPNIKTPKSPKETTRDSPQADRERAGLLARHRKLHPLPNRMPLFVELQAEFDIHAKRCQVLRFMDDEWDGSIADAFTRVHVSDYDEYTHDFTPITGVVQGTNRVLVSISRGQAAQKGIRKDDVVSHINGEIFQGNALDLTHLIHSVCKSDHMYTLTMVLNADERTTEVLRMRAMNTVFQSD